MEFQNISSQRGPVRITNTRLLLLTGPLTTIWQELLELRSLKIQHFPSQYFISVYGNVDFQAGQTGFIPLLSLFNLIPL